MNKIENSLIIQNVIDVGIEELIPNVIDNYIVMINDNKHTIILPMYTSTMQLKMWYKNKGGIFSKDVYNYSKGREHGKYALLKTDEENTNIIRLIDENEKSKFKSLKLIDGIVKDIPYMILKTVKNSERLCGMEDFINDGNVYMEELEQIEINELNIPIDDNEIPLKSVSLFDE